MSRWILLDETSPSGKTLVQCTQCGRVSQTADKWCGTTCGDQIEHVEFLQAECYRLQQMWSDELNAKRALQSELDRLRGALNEFGDAQCANCKRYLPYARSLDGQLCCCAECAERIDMRMENEQQG